MIKDHTAVNNNAAALVTKLGVTPEASDTSKSLQSQADTEQRSCAASRALPSIAPTSKPGGVSPAGSRCDQRRADSECAECRAEENARRRETCIPAHLIMRSNRWPRSRSTDMHGALRSVMVGAGLLASAALYAAEPPMLAVKMEKESFVPAKVSATTGTQVTWTNTDTVPHSVTADDNRFDSGPILPGKSFQWTATNTGTIALSLHLSSEHDGATDRSHCLGHEREVETRLAGRDCARPVISPSWSFVAADHPKREAQKHLTGSGADMKKLNIAPIRVDPRRSASKRL